MLPHERLIAEARDEIVAGREDAASWIEPPVLARAFVAMYSEALSLLEQGKFEQCMGAISAAKAATIAAGASHFRAGT